MKKIIAMVLWVTVLCFCQTSHATSIEDVIVEAKGTGATRKEAIDAALVEAISQVRGVNVNSVASVVQSLTAQTEEKNTNSGTITKTEIEFGENSKQNTQTATSGTVKSYQVISETASAINEGDIDVTLFVTISKYKKSIESKRKRIAVLPFRLAQNTNIEAEFPGLLSKEIVNYLTQTRRFAILDRDYLTEKNSEFDLLLADDVKIEEKSRIGNTLGTDYILTGTLLYANASTTSETIPYTNKVSEILSIDAAISWRLIEVATGQVLLSKNTHFQRSIEEEIETRWIYEMIESMGEEVASDIVNNIYPLMPVAYANGLFTIAQGGDTVQIGQIYTLIKQGNIIYDPYTKEAVAKEEFIVGTVEITQVTPKICYAKIRESTLSENDLRNVTERQYILRPIDMREQAAMQRPRTPPPTQTPNW